jgi:hypothetical protein
MIGVRKKLHQNDNDEDEDIGDSMEEYVALNTNEIIIEKIKSLKN